MKKAVLVICTLMAAAAACWGAGSVQSTTAALGQIPSIGAVGSTYVVTFLWKADASDASVPLTPATTVTPLAGYVVTQVEIQPLTPAPSSGYSVAVRDQSGLDILNGTAISLSATAAQSFAASASATPIYGPLSLNVTQTNPGASGRVYVFLMRTAGGTSTVSGGGGGGGGLNSIGLSVPNWLSVANSPLTANGTLVVTPTVGQTSHQFIGTCGVLTQFQPCSILPSDIPTLNQNTTGNAATATLATTASALTGTPNNCTLPQVASGIAANGNALCVTPTTGGLGSSACAAAGGSGGTQTFTYTATVNCNYATVTAATTITVGGVSGGSGAYIAYIINQATGGANQNPITWAGVTVQGFCAIDNSSTNAVTQIIFDYVLGVASILNCQSVTDTGVASGLLMMSQGTLGPPKAANAAAVNSALGSTPVANATTAANAPASGISGLGTGVAGALAANVSGTGGICLTSGSACSGGSGSNISCSGLAVSVTTSPVQQTACNFSSVALAANACLHIESVTWGAANQQLNISVGSTFGGSTNVSQPVNTSAAYMYTQTSLLCNNATGTAVMLAPFIGSYIPTSSWQGGFATSNYINDLLTPFPHSTALTWGSANNIFVSFQSYSGSGTANFGLKIY